MRGGTQLSKVIVREFPASVSLTTVNLPEPSMLCITRVVGKGLAAFRGHACCARRRMRGFAAAA